MEATQSSTIPQTVPTSSSGQVQKLTALGHRWQQLLNSSQEIPSVLIQKMMMQSDRIIELGKVIDNQELYKLFYSVRVAALARSGNPDCVNSSQQMQLNPHPATTPVDSLGASPDSNGTMHGINQSGEPQQPEPNASPGTKVYQGLYYAASSVLGGWKEKRLTRSKTISTKASLQDKAELTVVNDKSASTCLLALEDEEGIMSSKLKQEALSLLLDDMKQAFSGWLKLVSVNQDATSSNESTSELLNEALNYLPQLMSVDLGSITDDDVLSISSLLAQINARVNQEIIHEYFSNFYNRMADESVLEAIGDDFADIVVPIYRTQTGPESVISDIQKLEYLEALFSLLELQGSYTNLSPAVRFRLLPIIFNLGKKVGGDQGPLINLIQSIDLPSLTNPEICRLAKLVSIVPNVSEESKRNILLAFAHMAGNPHTELPKPVLDVSQKFIRLHYAVIKEFNQQQILELSRFVIHSARPIGAQAYQMLMDMIFKTTPDTTVLSQKDKLLITKLMANAQFFSIGA